MQSEIPLRGKPRDRRGPRCHLVGTAGERSGVSEQERRDGRGGAINGVRGIAGHVEQDLHVHLGNRHPQVGLQGVGGGGRPLAQGISAHAPILLAPARLGCSHGGYLSLVATITAQRTGEGT